MSLDISLNAIRETEVFDANYTHNVTSMWRLAGCYDALYKSEGQRAHNVLPALRAAVEAMRADPEAYRALEPANKWGTYDTALPWLEELVVAFEANPDGVIHVSA